LKRIIFLEAGYVDYERIKNIKNKMQLIKKTLDPAGIDPTKKPEEPSEIASILEKRQDNNDSKEEDLYLRVREEPRDLQKSRSPFKKPDYDEEEMGEESIEIVQNTSMN
jgi:hypothetical protein